MINEANDHPRYAVDVQRDQSKPGHPHATVCIKIYIPHGKKQAGNRKKRQKLRTGTIVKATVTVKGGRVVLCPAIVDTAILRFFFFGSAIEKVVIMHYI